MSGNDPETGSPAVDPVQQMLNQMSQMMQKFDEQQSAMAAMNDRITTLTERMEKTESAAQTAVREAAREAAQEAAREASELTIEAAQEAAMSANAAAREAAAATLAVRAAAREAAQEAANSTLAAQEAARVVAREAAQEAAQEAVINAVREANTAVREANLSAARAAAREAAQEAATLTAAEVAAREAAQLAASKSTAEEASREEAQKAAAARVVAEQAAREAAKNAAATITEGTRMRALTLGEYSGTKYDGTLSEHQDWARDIENKLRSHQVSAVLDDEEYHGRYLNNDRVTAGPILDDLVETGEDLQSVVAAYIIQSLSGSILTSVQHLQDERKSNPVGNRTTLTAYEIFQHARKEANPQLSRRSRDQVHKSFVRDTLAKAADRVAVEKYIKEQKERWDYLNRTAGPGGEDRLSEHTLVSQLLTGMETHHEPKQRAMEHTSANAEGLFTLQLLREGIERQFPKDYSSTTGTVLCAANKEDDTDEEQDEQDAKAKRKARSKAKRKEKRDQDKAYLQLGKEKEQELLSKSQQPTVLALRGLPANPPATQPAPSTQAVTLPSGMIVNVPI